MRIPSFLVSAALVFASNQLVLASNDITFHPNSFPKQIAICKALNRAVNHTTPVDIKLRMFIIPYTDF
jgi:hypothetical protein